MCGPLNPLVFATPYITDFLDLRFPALTTPYTDDFLHYNIILREYNSSFIFVILKRNRLITYRYLYNLSRLGRKPV